MRLEMQDYFRRTDEPKKYTMEEIYSEIKFYIVYILTFSCARLLSHLPHHISFVYKKQKLIFWTV